MNQTITTQTPPSEEDIERLRAALSAANEALREAERACTEEAHALMNRVEQKVRARHADRIRSLSEQSRLALRSLDTAIDLRIVSGALETDIKAGTRMIEWRTKSRFAPRSAPLEPTGVVGEWEVFRLGNKTPFGHYTPGAGTQGIRVLKKNGEPSSRFIACNPQNNLYRESAAHNNFYPEGVIPPRNLELAKS